MDTGHYGGDMYVLSYKSDTHHTCVTHASHMRHTCVTPSCDVSFRYITEVWKNNLEIYLLIHVEKNINPKIQNHFGKDIMKLISFLKIIYPFPTYGLESESFEK